MTADISIRQPQQTEYLQEVDTSKLDEISQKFGNKSVISYADLAKILQCNVTDMKVHSLANFLYFTLLYLPFRSPLSIGRGSRNQLSPNRIKDSDKWTDALFTNDGKHKSFIGRVAFSKTDGYVCHPITTTSHKAYVREDEFNIATQGMYGPVKIFYDLLRQQKTELLIPERRGGIQTHVEKLEKLRFLDLAEREKHPKGHIYDLEKFHRQFESCDSLYKFRHNFARFAIRNDFQLQRVILTLYFLKEKGRPYTLLPCSARKVKKGIKILSAKKPCPLSIYANLGPKTMDSIIEFTDFVGLDYYYSPPTVRKPSGKLHLFLASQVSTLSELFVSLQDTQKGIASYKSDIASEKSKVQADFLKNLLIEKYSIAESTEHLDDFLEENRTGCVVNLNLPLDSFDPCPSNVFVLTTFEPNSERFVEAVEKILMDQENKTLYYPHFRFTCCYTYGWHRYSFDRMFSRDLDTLRKNHIWRFYAVGRPGDVSHNISPSVVKATGQVFDHFKVIRR